MTARRLPRGVIGVLRIAAATNVLLRLAGAARTRPPIAPVDADRGADEERAPTPAISVVVPARDEEGRIGPLLDAIVGAPGVGEVIVVDDESSDATASLARSAGATVVAGAPRPAGWAGKPWALQQGLDAATGEWVVTLDADVRPAPALPAAAVVRAVEDGTDLLTLAGRFDCPTAGARWLHASMLTTLVYRFGPPGAERAPTAARTMANGQCMIARRDLLAGPAGMASVRGEVVEDVALARALAATGRRVDFLDAGGLLTVRMYDDLSSTWSGWARSLSLPGAEPTWRRILDLAVLVVTMPTPLARVVARRADVIDLVLLVARAGTLVGTRTAYRRIDAAYWASPLADGASVVALALGIVRRHQTWRGRSYATGRAADRSPRSRPRTTARRRRPGA